MKLAELLAKTENPLARLLILGGAALAQWAYDKRYDRLSLERWEDEGGYVADLENTHETH